MRPHDNGTIQLLYFFSGRNRNHGHNVCSSWGNHHFKTFDGDFYRFPGRCSYNLASHCSDSYQEFLVHVHRSMDRGHPLMDKITIGIKGVIIDLKVDQVTVDGEITNPPFYKSGILVQKYDDYIKVYTKIGLTVMWNKEDAIMLELDPKYNNQTCGLCGDYNGIPVYNEFFAEEYILSPVQFGNLQNIHDPSDEQCTDVDETQEADPGSCSQYRSVCEGHLAHAAFSDCRDLLNVEAYINACMLDMCSCDQSQDSFCLCSTITEFSRQCSHAGGLPGDWRTDHFCSKQCPANMIHKESASPCKSSCSDPELHNLCEEHNMDGCFCPEGTVLDDYTDSGCVTVSECHCKHKGTLYAPGDLMYDDCTECQCDSGKWNCTNHACPGVCSIEGGAHITTFDGKAYTFHGNCYYVLSEARSEYKDKSYIILGELTPCSSSERETCLKTVELYTDNYQNVVNFKADGTVLLNGLAITLPHIAARYSIIQPSDSHIIVQATFGLQMQIQLLPMMQLYITIEKSPNRQLQGLCGDFNSKEMDDFRTSSGVVEATASAFANTWKTEPHCPDVSNWLDDPCSLSIEKEKYATAWCSELENEESPFGKCHSTIHPAEYVKRCHYDSCNCKDSEQCMCAALSSYVRACAAKGIILWGWRKDICDNNITSCPSSQVFLYNLTTCQPTCRSLAEGEKACASTFSPVDGCGCPDGELLNEKGLCVSMSKCSCYHRGSYLSPLQVIPMQDELCTCHNGKLICNVHLNQTCPVGKVYYNCSEGQLGVSRSRVHRSCKTLAVENFQTECIPGCVCPYGLLDDGAGGDCVPEEQCPCEHNKDTYIPGSKIKVDCNTCLCQRGQWTCTNAVCYGTCTMYGSGHYITFDGKHYDFDGECKFVAAQDYCGASHSNGSFRIITENVPCGTTGATCSKSIKVFLGNKLLNLEDKTMQKVELQSGKNVEYLAREVGIYLVIEASNGILLIWDRKTTILIKVSPNYKGELCGLCGNFDDNSQNDFKTSHMSPVSDVLEFGNSWKVDSLCPEQTKLINPCNMNSHRRSWAEKQCSLIKSQVFHICHNKVDPIPFYEACVNDACSCDSGGDCECFCTAVAAYAQECTKAEACVFWRTPDICPIFCDYYNPKDKCEWHYHPCGNHSIQTCRSINNICSNVTITYLEGCYPTCPPERPIFDEEKRTCITKEQCGCYIDHTYYNPGEEVPDYLECHKCVCYSGKLNCLPEDSNSSVPMGNGLCNETRCVNGTKTSQLRVCRSTTPVTSSTTPVTTPPVTTTTTETTRHISTTPTSTTLISIAPVTTAPTSTSPTTKSTTGSSATSILTSTTTTIASSSTTSPVTVVDTSTTTNCTPVCSWSEWYDVSYPSFNTGGEYETYENIRNNGFNLCEKPLNISCSAKFFPDTPLKDLQQDVICDVSKGLICKNGRGPGPICYDYQIRVYCCEVPHYCLTTTYPASTIESTTTPTTITTTSIPTEKIELKTTNSPFTTPESTAKTLLIMSEETTSTKISTPIFTSTEAPTTSTEETAVTQFPTKPTTTESKATTPTIITTAVTTSTTANCTPVCSWSQWYDVSYPSFNTGGEYETYENIRNNGFNLCEKPLNISCSAKFFPDTPLKDLQQDVICDVSKGLICKNNGLGPRPICYDYQIRVYCCEVPHYCLTTTSPTSTTTAESTTPPTTITTTSIPTENITSETTNSPFTTSESTAKTFLIMSEETTTTKFSTSIFTSTEAPTTSTEKTAVTTQSQTKPTITESEATTPAIITTAVTTSTTANCTRVCSWSQWYDVSSPSFDTGGEYETYENIRKNGHNLCEFPEDIFCRAKSHPEDPIEKLNQNVTCDVFKGLTCRNNISDYTRPLCYDYRVRVYCCTVPAYCLTPTTIVPSFTTTESATTTHPTTSKGFTTSASSTTTTELTTPSTTTTTEYTSTIPTTTTTEITTTSLPTITAESTTLVHSTTVSAVTNIPTTTADLTTISHSAITTESTITTSAKTLTESVSTAIATTTEESTTTTPATTTAHSALTTTHNISSPITSSLESTITTIGKTSTPIFTTTEIQTGSSVKTQTPTRLTTTEFQTASTSTTSSSLATTELSSTTLETYTTTNCTRVCSWSQWYDVSSPSFDTGGEYETYENIRKNGHNLCEFPDDIFCRAKSRPEDPIEKLNQNVTCDVFKGLTCRNNISDYTRPLCYDYRVRVYCCVVPAYCSTPTTTRTPSSTTTESATTTHPTTTTELTTPSTATTTWYTSTIPATTTSKTSTPIFTTTEIQTASSENTQTSTTPTTTEFETTSSSPTTYSVASTGLSSTTLETYTTTRSVIEIQTVSTTTPDHITENQRVSTTSPGTTKLTVTTEALSTVSAPVTTSITTVPVTNITTVNTVSTTSACVCVYGGTPYPPGEIISGTANDICYKIICNKDCVIKENYWICLTTPATSTPASATPNSQASQSTSAQSVSTQSTPSKQSSTHTTTSTKSTSTTTKVKSTTTTGCVIDQYREQNEVWMLCNCTEARCIENNIVEITQKKCEPPPMITCANGRQPIQVPDDDLCCWHWECECLCSGWGDPHYRTFDGTFYSFQGTCTYTLVEEIEKRVDNFGIYVDNYDCGTGDPVSCTRNVIVRHESQEIQIRRKNLIHADVQVIVNGEIVGVPFKRYGVKIYTIGIYHIVEIVNLKTNVTFNGQDFSVKMPYHLFGNNTQGQCGTCTNNQADDCRTRSGDIVSSCVHMAHTWVVPDLNKPTCGPLTTRSVPKEPSTTRHCLPSPMCNLIIGKTFQECHSKIPPMDYHQACVFDSCHVNDSSMACTSLQHYALLCGEQGVCINWRSQVPECAISCPSHRTYNACGPAEPRTCQTTPEEDAKIMNDKRFVEGCFCPENTMPFSEAMDVCVSTCGCVGPDKVPRKYGEEFQLDCQDCVCREGGSGIMCQEHQCKEMKDVKCELEGFYLDIQSQHNDTCCSESICKCDVTKCSTKPPRCDLGYEAISDVPVGHCCPVYICVRKNVCVHENAEFMLGARTYPDKCLVCECSENANTSAGVEMKCSHVLCTKQCPLGFALKKSLDDCCGVCEQTHCILHNDGLSQLIKPEEILRSESNCTVYSCNVIRNQFITSVSTIACPAFNEDSCEPGTTEVLPNGCCKICIEKNASCKLYQDYDYLYFNNCQSTEKVKISRCDGQCETLSIYSAAARAMSHKCSCCQEVKTTQKQVKMQCADGTEVEHEYIDVEECNCVNTGCGASQTAGKQSPARARRAIKSSVRAHNLP
ncbi:mucin-2-like [Hyperolius riggenbachi]|uniref:mucin-2-like n=1 Tax=Hyperolius riggenbachi TaxID=752182 RepID=UPI0035A38AC2